MAQNGLTAKEKRCRKGELSEIDWVQKIAPLLGLNAIINPAKTDNVYAPDLIVNGRIADLKHKRVPFYSAGFLYAINPQYAVTFKVEDFKRYIRDYPDIDIYFWVDWKCKKLGRLTLVKPMVGTFRVNIQEIAKRIRFGKPEVPKHIYNDSSDGDAYVFDVSTFTQIF